MKIIIIIIISNSELQSRDLLHNNELKNQYTTTTISTFCVHCLLLYTPFVSV